MITEQELEMALELRKQIKETKMLIAKLEEAVIAETSNLNNGISIDGNKLPVDEFTKATLLIFKEDITEVLRKKLEEQKNRYKEIIENPNDTLRRILEEDG